MKKIILLLSCVSYGCVSYGWAQALPVTPISKCIIPFFLTAVGNKPSTTGFDNRQMGCNNWTLTYSSAGFSAVSLILQSAPPGATTDVPGTYVNFAGSLSSGINPNTATTQAQTQASGYFPWIRVRLNSATGSGTVLGVLVGDSAGNNTSTVSVTGYDISTGNNKKITLDSGGDVNSAAIVPADTIMTLGDGLSNVAMRTMEVGIGQNFPTFRVLPFQFNGSTWDRPFVCASQASFNLSGSGNTQIVALSGSTVIRICHLSFSTTAAEDVKITTGTGSNCGSGTADLTGLYKGVQSMDLNFGADKALRGTAANAVCINQSAAQALGGVVIYAQY